MSADFISRNSFFQPKAMEKKGKSSVFQQKESSSSSKYGKRNDKIFRNSVIRNCFSYITPSHNKVSQSFKTFAT